MKLYLLDADYIEENNQTVVRLFCKDANRKTIVCLDYDFEPYFYILAKEGKEKEVKKRVESIKSVRIKGVEIVERMLSGEKEKFVKVSCFLSTDVPNAREIVKGWRELVEEEYEYSINFYKRYLIDNQIENWVEVEGEEIKKSYKADKVIKVEKVRPVSSDKIPKLKLMSFDIESVDENGKPVIVMLSLKSCEFEKVLTYRRDKHYGKYVEVLKDEKELLERFVEIVNEQDPDILLGFNSDEFDAQIIQKRAEELKVDLTLSRDSSKLKFARRARISTARFKGIVHIDLFQFINNILSPQLQTEVLSLDAVSAELLNDNKIEIEYEEILESWRKSKDLAKLAEYCLKDSDLTLRLGESILPQIYELAELSGQLLFDTSRMTYSQLVEWYLSKRAFAMNTIIPNQPKWDEIERRREYSPYEGGFVKEPIGGLHEEIAVMDFRSLYPSLIATFNISPETLNYGKRKEGYEVPGTDYWFCKEPKGFVSTVIRELIETRSKIKQRMKRLKESEERDRLKREQFAVKTVCNATYGYFGFASSKWYCRECALSSAAFGRFYIKKVIDEAEKEGFTVIYGDSISKDRFVTVIDDAGMVHIKNIEELFNEFHDGSNTPGKQYADVYGYNALSVDPITHEPGWYRIRRMMRHRAGKKMFRVVQKFGETVATEDHSIMTLKDGKLSETRPEDMSDASMFKIESIPHVERITEVDLFKRVSKYSVTLQYKGREKIAIAHTDGGMIYFGWTHRKDPVIVKRFIRNGPDMEALCRLVGAYVSEGSSSTPETTRTRMGVSIASSNKQWLLQLKEDYEQLFNTSACIIPSMRKMRSMRCGDRMITYTDSTYKLQMMNGMAAVLFKTLCGQRSDGKRLPDFVFNLPEKYQRIILENMILGDGSRKFMNMKLPYSDEYKKNNFSYTTKSLGLASGLTFMLTMLGIKHSLKYRETKKVYVITTTGNYNAITRTKLISEDYDGHVYDLEVEGSHMFVDSCGQVLLHNTDSMFVKTKGNLKVKVKSFLKKMNDVLPGIIELDLQGIYQRGIFIPKGIGPGTAKKRYALIDDKGVLTIRGLEKVRRDWSNVAKDTQEKVLKLILEKKDVKGAVTYVKNVIKDLKNAKIPLKDLIIIEQLTKPLSEYKAIGPHVVAARKIKERGRPIGEGMPIMFIITKGEGSISERSEPFEDVEAKQVDYDYYIEHQIIPAALRVLTVLGVTEEELIGQSLKSFLK